jgi:hypothetical protein
MEPKTQASDADVAAFLATIPDEQRRADSEAICRLIAEETGESPRMWGKAIVGFGSYRMTYADGREADWMALGFSRASRTWSCTSWTASTATSNC